MRFETKAIHVGQDPEPEFGSVNVPIYQTSTYAQEAVGKPKRYDYARAGNPTREALETVVAALESGAHGLSFASGLAAETTLLLARLRPGDHLVLGDDVYGGTYRLLARVLSDWGVAFDTVDMTDLDAVRGAVRDETRVIWVETPTHPFLQNAVGAVPGPMDCYLALRGVKTLAVRMEAHCRGAKRVAEFLSSHPKVTRVHYPGLPDHPQHAVAARQMRDFGGMVSFEMSSPEETIRMAEATELFFLGESLGGVESLIEVPGPMTHPSG